MIGGPRAGPFWRSSGPTFRNGYHNPIAQAAGQKGLVNTKDLKILAESIQ